MEQFYSKRRVPTEVDPFRCQGFVRGGTISCRDGRRVSIQSLPAFLRALLVTDGTVTKILEAYFWEPVIVDTLYQEFISATSEIPWVDIHPGDRALLRRARLRGGDSEHEYARADSVIRAERVPDHFRQRLIDREIGIGALIRDSGMESYREVMEVGLNSRQSLVNESTGAAESDAKQTTDEDALFRTYRIIIDREPVILITETFPLALFQ